MASIEDFVLSPDEGVLDSFKKEELLKLADHGVELSKKFSKAEMLFTLKGHLLEKKVFPVVSEPAQVSKVAGVGLTFEQQRQLMQEEHKNLMELERARKDARLQEAEIAHSQVRQQLELERYKLELMSEGKLQTDSHKGELLSFDVSVSFRLVPKFNERDSDIFFILFERLADARNWSDAERTLLLQCVLTGKAQEAFSAMSVIDSGSYHLVKAAVLRIDELVPEAYRQCFRSLKKETQTHVEFARDLTTLFSHWCAASQINTTEEL